MNEINILEIFSLIDENNDLSNQQRGIDLAQNVNKLDLFFQPIYQNYNKNIWENCAIIICNRKNEELINYLHPMFEWIQDINWPGALQILNKLKTFEYETIHDELIANLEIAINNGDLEWIENMCDLIDDINLKNNYLNIVFKKNIIMEQEYQKEQQIETVKFNQIIQIPKILEELKNKINLKANVKFISNFIDPIFIPYLIETSNIDDEEIKYLCNTHLKKIYTVVDKEKISIFDETFNKEFLNYISNNMNDIKNFNFKIHNNLSLENILLLNNIILKLNNNIDVAIILRILNLFQNKKYLIYFEKYSNDNDLKIKTICDIGKQNLRF